MNSTPEQAAGAGSPVRPVFDVSSQRIATVYAEALLAAAQRRNQVDEVLEEFDSLLTDVFRAFPEFETFCTGGAISRRARAEVVQRVLGGRASEVFVNFLLVLNDHDRLDLLHGIHQAAHELQDERAGKVQVVVRSAVPLPEAQRELLRQQLQATFHKEPILQTRVDAELLGGLIVKVGDWLYDASVRGRVDEIQNQLIESSSHEIQSRRDRFRSDA